MLRREWWPLKAAGATQPLSSKTPCSSTEDTKTSKDRHPKCGHSTLVSIAACNLLSFERQEIYLVWQTFFIRVSSRDTKATFHLLLHTFHIHDIFFRLANAQVWTPLSLLRNLLAQPIKFLAIMHYRSLTRPWPPFTAYHHAFKGEMKFDSYKIYIALIFAPLWTLSANFIEIEQLLYK